MFYKAHQKNFFKSRSKIKKHKKKYRGFILTIFFIFFVMTLKKLDKKIFDITVAQSKFVINRMISSAISNAVNKIILKDNLKSSDFCTVNSSKNPKDNQIESVVANTVLINKFCNELAADINKEFSKMGSGTVKIPFGSILSFFSGINFINNLGPDLKINLIPSGDASIDYETKFISAGINQTGFQIWLDIKFECEIINALQRKNILFNKKIPLVDMIINGTVPSTYIDSKKF